MKPSSIFRKAVLASVISSTFALTGCGGSDDDNKTTTPSADSTDSSNKAPIVSIAGEAQAKEKEEFKLTADASDSDGSIATYAWSHNSDLDLVLSGADTPEFTVKSPDISEDTAVTFTLTVTDDDGATASIDKAVVIKRRVSSVTITGIVTDKPIENANLTIFAGSSSINAVADETGRYSATFTVDESESAELVQIRATGLGNQDNVEFVSQLNSMDKLVEQAGEDGELISDENFGVNITNVTTAEYALLTRDGEAFSTDEELQQALLNVDAEQKLRLAALIKIVVDNDDYDLPEGVTSTLDLVDDAVTAAQFEQAVNERDSELIEKTEKEIKEDDDLVTTSTTLGAGDFIIHSPEFVTNSAYHLSLGADGKGGSVSAVNQVEIDTWTVTDGKLEVSLATPLVVRQGNEQKRDADGYPVQDDFGNYIYEDVKYKTSKLTVLVLAENEVYRTVDYTLHTERYVQSESGEVLDESYEYGETSHTANLLDKTKTLEVTQDDLLGTWYLDIRERNYFGETINPVEKLTLLEGGQVQTAKEDETITWKVENNLLTLTYTYVENGVEATGSMTMWITKSLAAGYQFVAMDNGTAEDSNDAHAKSEWGWLFKQDADLKITKEDVVGRWHGWIGFNQNRHDMVVDADLNVKFGLNENSRDGRFEDGVFYRERYREDGQDVRFCDVANDNCQLIDQFKYEIVAVEDDQYFVHRVTKSFNSDGSEKVHSDFLSIYEYTSELKYSEFTIGLLASDSTFYTYNDKGKLVEGSFDYYIDYSTDSLVTELKVDDQTYVFSLVDGKLEYNTPEGRFVVELIEHTDDGLKVCTYPQGESCTDENTVVWSFKIPHVGEFFINNPEYFNSSTYKIKLEQSRWSKEASVKLPDSMGENTFSWQLEDGVIVLPIARQLSSFMTNIDGKEVYQEVYLNYIKLKISNDGTVEVEESRTTYHDHTEVSTQINQYDAQKLEAGDFLPIEESDVIGTWAIDGATVNNIGEGLYTFNDSGVGSANLGINDGEQQSIDFNWEIVDGTLKVMHTDGINVEHFHITKDLRVDGYQAVAERSEYESSWVSSSLLVKQQSGINYTAADYIGRWLYKDGEDAAEAFSAMEIYDGLEVRFGTTLSSIQGESVKDGQFIRSRYINPLENNKIVAPCEVQTETCQLRFQMIYTPLATENNRTYFHRTLNNWWNGEVYESESTIFVKDKADTIEIPKLEKYMNFGMQDSSDQYWRSSEIGTDGDVTTYSLTIGDAEPLPYTLDDGKITIRMADGLVYNIELIPGSNTKEGITLCKYLASESCEAGEEIKLNYPVVY